MKVLDLDSLWALADIALQVDQHDLAGDPGTWVLFYNSVLLHCGIPPRVPWLTRTVMEITLVPWLRFTLQPRYLGVNGKHPVFQLINDMEGI